jgi:hypothetical protein
VISRFLSVLPARSSAFRMPAFSGVDYLVCEADEAVGALEIKVRRESLETVRGYGGLMLKHRKIAEASAFESFTRLPVRFVFAFDNGAGPILVTAPERVAHHPPEPPPRRREFRGLACDEEPVIFLDWDADFAAVIP